MKAANIPLFGALIPSDPTVTIDRAENGTPIRYSIDAMTETKMQRQRMAAIIAGPVVMWAGWHYEGGWGMRLLIMATGGTISAANLATYMAVRKAQKEA